MKGHNMQEKNKVLGKNFKYFLLLPILMSLTALARNLDNDIWFLLTHGRYVLEKGFPMIEPFTIHEGFKFVMQQWLSAVVFFLTYSNFGEMGLKFLVVASYLIGAFIFYKLCMKVSKNQIHSILATYLYVIMISVFMTTRPFIFTSILMLCELLALETYYLENNKKALLAFPLLSLILINFQAAMWPMLFVISLPFIVDAFKFKVGPIKGQGIQKKPLFFAILSMIPLGFFNPYGLDGMLYIRNSYGVGEINRMIIEMAPAKADSILGFIIIIMVTGISYFYIFNSKQKLHLRHVLLALGTGFLSLITIRGFLFFICCGIYPLAMLIDTSKIPQYDQVNPERTLKIRKLLIVLIAILSIISFSQIYSDTKEEASNKELFKDLLENVIKDSSEEEIVLYTGYNDGGMAEFYRVAPYIDPRAEVFVKKNNMVDDVFTEYYKLQTGQIHYKEVLEKYHFSHLIVGKQDLLYTYLPYEKEYFLVESNAEYALYKQRY